MEELLKVREELDKLDNELVELFTKRMSLSAEVARIKKEQDIPVLNQGREQQILDRLTGDSDDDMKKYIIELYTKIFDISRDYQKTLLEK